MVKTNNKSDDVIVAYPSQQEILEKKAKDLGVLFLVDAPRKIDKKTIVTISEEVARKYQMVVFEKKGRVLKVAMINPQDVEALNVLRFVAEKDEMEVEIYLVTATVFQEIAANYSSAEKAVEEVMRSLKDIEIDDSQMVQKSEDQAEEVIQDAPVSKLVQVIIDHAIEGKASDVHIEPMDKDYRVRFRMDGILHSSLSLPKNVGRAVVSRIKILSNLKIDERRKPQDGRFKIEKQGRIVDFRISTFPVIEGEKAVIRVLDREEGIMNFETLGLVGRNFEVMNEEIRSPFGIILITGPTGSGKSTTLYAFLQILNKEERNIVTLEDPVEYYIEGINQSQIKPEIGYTFASGLRSLLRQDPNIIMVGEIRDSETAELAIHAALTGHLVFSTLHTNDSVGAIPRLVDMGVQPFLISASLNVVAAQRLVRKICPDCREEVEMPLGIREKIKKEIENIPSEEIKKYGIDLSSGLKFYRGKGCELCGNLGLKGRMAIFEAFDVDSQVKEVIIERRANEAEIRSEAVRQKMLTMRQDGILKVLRGLTTLSEVERVTDGSRSEGGEVDDDRG
jgi:type IV pilus assembly protein PilB